MAKQNVGQEQIKIIGAGFGRTGTNSLRIALNKLGYNTYHMHDVIKYEEFPLWLNEIRKKNQILQKIYLKQEITLHVLIFHLRHSMCFFILF